MTRRSLLRGILRIAHHQVADCGVLTARHLVAHGVARVHCRTRLAKSEPGARLYIRRHTLTVADLDTADSLRPVAYESVVDRVARVHCVTRLAAKETITARLDGLLGILGVTYVDDGSGRG